MMRGRYSKVLRAVGVGTAVLMGGIFSTAANASPLTAKQAVARSGADEVNLTRAATNCGDGTSYLPTSGQAMTAADYAALGLPVPPTGSPLTRPGTRWVVPRCAHLPAGQHPGGPAVRSALTVSPQVGIRSAASAQMGASPNWTGFQSNGGGPYNDAFTEWTIPSSFPTPPGDTYESSWAGIGSGASDKNALFQAGTETNVNTGDGVSNYAWWEFYPANAQQVVNLSISSGSVDYAEVSHTGYGQGLAQVCTEPPGQSSFTCIAIGVSWGTAYAIGSSQFECIAERTDVGGVYPRLTDITGVGFYGCQAYTSSWQYIGNINRVYWWMAKTQTASQCFTAPWAVETGSIYDSYDFGFRWYGYGWPIPAADC
jgi:Peptidase A4 family